MENAQIAERIKARSSPMVGAVLLASSLGLILLGGCFLIGILALMYPSVVFGPQGSDQWGPREIAFVSVLYSASIGCFLAAIYVGYRGVRAATGA
jgi:hypothetical protein